MHKVQVGPVLIGRGAPLAVIAGPCLLESRELGLRTAEALAAAARRLGLGLIFKSSFDKANRSSGGSPRGPGLEQGLGWLSEIRAEVGVPVTTDVHAPEQCAPVAEVVDLLQIPAFLSRQTDLLTAAAATGRPVNLKKGQFMAPWDVPAALEKLAGAPGRLVTERGTSFGYNRLVVDLAGLGHLLEGEAPVVLDCTHAVQQPGGAGSHSLAERRFAPLVARAGVAAGVHAIFAEVHPDPDRAWSDAAAQLPLASFPDHLATWARLAELVRSLT